MAALATEGERRSSVVSSVLLASGQCIEVRHGDLTEESCAAIVNPANNDLDHQGGLARAISKAGGETIQLASDAWLVENGTMDEVLGRKVLPDGKACVTTAGSLPCGQVVHAVGPIWPGGPRNESNPASSVLRETIASVLDLAHQLGLPDVSIPAISTGIFGFPLKLAARLIVDVVVEWLIAHSDSTLRSVALTNIDKATVNAMNHALTQSKRSGRLATVLWEHDEEATTLRERLAGGAEGVAEDEAEHAQALRPPEPSSSADVPVSGSAGLSAALAEEGAGSMGVDEAGEAGELEELTADEMAAFEERLLQEQLENALASGPLLERQESFTDEAWLREAQEHDDLVYQSLAAQEGGENYTTAEDEVNAEAEIEAGAGAGLAAEPTEPGLSEDVADLDLEDIPEVPELDREQSYGTDWQQEEWSVDRLMKRKRIKGVTCFLVQWKFHPDTTWETEEDLIEEGYQTMIDAFHRDKKRVEMVENSVPVKVLRIRYGESGAEALVLWKGRGTPTWDSMAALEMSKHKEKIKELFEKRKKEFQLSASDSDPAGMIPNPVQKILSLFQSPQAVLKIEWIGRSDLIGSLRQKWTSLSSSNAGVFPTIVFHGTASTNIRPIITMGLRIPGTGGVKVVNGSAYGVGIYTAKNPVTSMGYCRGGNQMLACIGLVGKGVEERVKEIPHNGFCVYFDAALVVPCYLVTFRQGAPALTDLHQKNMHYENLKRAFDASVKNKRNEVNLKGERKL